MRPQLRFGELTNEHVTRVAQIEAIDFDQAAFGRRFDIITGRIAGSIDEEVCVSERAPESLRIITEFVLVIY